MMVRRIDGLRPCPFCGSPAELVTNGSGDDFVRCSNKSCACRTRQYHENVNGPVEQWNTRVGDQSRTGRAHGD